MTKPDIKDTQVINQANPDGQYFYKVRFRNVGQEYTIGSHLGDLVYHEVVIVKTEHGPEPGLIVSKASTATAPGIPRKVSYQANRRANREEVEKFDRLPGVEQDAFNICLEQIEKLKLNMNLVRVERFFNGSKIIFYFTAESRVDFRELVKKLVQEFRTRVEMRQIGVRHETQMTGGIGPCGRELCCSSFLNKFESVSIKMAKAQDLPLNPAKISGLCNRLLCCLTYEYDSYRSMKKGMPRIGKWINCDEVEYKVIRLMPLQDSVLAVSREGEETVLNHDQWKNAEPVRKISAKQQSKKK